MCKHQCGPLPPLDAVSSPSPDCQPIFESTADKLDEPVCKKRQNPLTFS